MFGGLESVLPVLRRHGWAEEFEEDTAPGGACTMAGGVCPEHGFVHGHEAEELRKGIENIVLSHTSRFWRDALRDLLDKVDARDSLAYLERRRRPRKPKGGP